MSKLHSSEAAEHEPASRHLQKPHAALGVGPFANHTRRKTDHLLREQAHLLDMIFTHSLDSMAVLDKDYNFVRVSDSYARACQREVHEFAGRNHFELYPSSFEQEHAPYREQKKPYSCSARPFVFPDHPEWGVTYWDIAMVPILDLDGEIEYFLLTLKDVTAAVSVEERNQDYIRRLKELSMCLVAVQEAERAALARELHDEIGQSLTAVKIQLQAMQAQVAADCAPGLGLALSTMSDLLDRVRGLSLDLRPMQLDDFGLHTALHSLIERTAVAAGWKVRADIAIAPEARYDRGLELACFRVAQEALTNAMRHAAASSVRVTLRQRNSALHLQVRDDGRGFDPAQPKSGPQFGLFSMEERVRNMQGQFAIRSIPHRGTEVRASFPLTVPGETRA